MRNELQDLLGPDEGVVHETRQHPIVLVRDAGVAVLGMIVVAVLIWYDGDAGWLDNRFGDWLGYALWIGFAALLLLVIWRVLGWWTERFYVTTGKIVYIHGVLNRDVMSTPLVKIDEVTLARPLLGRMLGFGRLDVENASGGTEPLAGLEYLPKAAFVYRTITERARNQRMLEGGGHQDRDGDGLVDRPEPAAAAAPAEPIAPAATEPVTPDPHVVEPD